MNALKTLPACALALCVQILPAQADRPHFQAPFPCGQIWRASTYAGHASDAIDLVERNSEQTIIGEDQPTTASAAGTVTFDHTWPGGSKLGERWVIVDHGDGWRTHYFHLEAEEGKPRLAVGRKVAMGEVLGKTSNSGTPAIHLHYAQMKDIGRDAENLNDLANASVDNWGRVLSDGDKVRVRFDGKRIDTYFANRDSWNTFGRDSAEKIRSLNCPAGRFVHWYSRGDSYMLRYSPGGWDIRLNRIHPTGGDNPLMLSQNLGANWNTIVPFYAAANNQPHIFLYNFANGETHFRRVSPQNDSLTFLKSVRKYAGWTEIVPIRMGGKPHAVFYDSRYGWLNVDEINVTSTGFISRLKTKIGTGFTNLVAYEEGPRRYVLTYRGATGRMQIHRLSKRANGTVTREEVWSARRKAGWTHLTLLLHRGRRHVLGYNSLTGEARLWTIKNNGGGLEGGAQLNWSPGWTALTPYLHDGRAHVLAYRASDGLSRKIRLKDNLSGFRTFTTEDWANGYR